MAESGASFRKFEDAIMGSGLTMQNGNQVVRFHKGGNLARRRYQNPRPYQVGKTRRWEIAYRKDIIGEDGVVRRVKMVETLGYYPEMTLKQAQRAAQAVIEPLNASSYTPSRIAPFKVIAERWMETVLPEQKASTQCSVRSHIRKHLIPAFGNIQMHNFTPEMIQSWVAHQNKSVAISSRTVRHIIMTFRSVWKTAMAWGYATENPLDKIVLRPPAMVEVRCFTEQEIQKILMASEEPYKTFYRLAAECGMRAGELCGLRFDDVDVDSNILRVRHSSWRGRIGPPKSKSGIRTFPISEGLASAILALRHMRVEKFREPDRAGRKPRPIFTVRYAYDPNYMAPGDDFVFRTSNGTPWNQQDILKRHLHPLLKRLGIPRAGLHAFRHFVATQLDRHQAPSAVMKQLLGHASLETTDRYVHLVTEDARRIADALEIQAVPQSGGMQ